MLARPWLLPLALGMVGALVALAIYLCSRYSPGLVLVSVSWVTLGVAVVLVSRRLFSSLLNPLSVYFGFWCGGLALYYLRLVDFNLMGPVGLSLVFLSMASFGVGALVASPRKGLPPPDPSGLTDPETVKFLEKTLYLVTGLAIAGVCYYWFSVDRAIGFTSAITRPWLLDYELNQGSLQHLGPLGRLYTFTHYIVPLSLFLMAINPGRRWLYTAFLALGILAQLNTRRSWLYFSLLWGLYAAVIAVSLLRRAGSREIARKASRFMAGLAGSFVCLLVAYFAVTQVIFSKSFVYTWFNQSRVSSRLPGPLVDTYLYSCASFAALEPHLERENTVSFQNTLWVPRKVAHALAPSVFAEPEANIFDYEGVYIPFWWNVSPYIRHIHADFGIPGVALIPFLLAFVVCWFFVRMGRSPTPPAVMFSSYMMFVLSETVIGFELLKYDAYWTILLLGAWAIGFRACRRRHRNEPA